MKKELIYDLYIIMDHSESVTILEKEYEISTTVLLHLCLYNADHYIDSPSIKNLSNLVNLQELKLFRVDLTIFPNIRNLDNLKVLKLSNNQFETLPDYICNFKNLISLEISWQKKLISLPDSIGNLKKLQILHIEDNQNLKIIPDTICNIKSLRFLSCRNNKITILPQDIGLLTNLKFLDIEYNQLTTLPKSIGRLKYDAYMNLPVSFVGYNPYTDVQLKDKTSVEILDIMKKEWQCIEKKRSYKTKFMLLSKVVPTFPIEILSKIIDDQYKGECAYPGYDIISRIEKEQI